jgi:hypothetical protein
MKQFPDKNFSDYIDSRIRDIELAAQRSRWTYIALITVSWLIIAMAYNSTFSFSRAIADGSKRAWDCANEADIPQVAKSKERAEFNSCPQKAQNGNDESETKQDGLPDTAQKTLQSGGDSGAIPKSPTTWMRSNYLRDWVGSLFFDLPIVGGRFSAADAGIIGGIALMLITVWGFFSLRRENHLVYYLVRDAKDWGWPTNALVYLRVQLAATQVFSSGWHDEPMGRTALTRKTDQSPVRKSDIKMRFLAGIMFQLPFVALLTVLTTDIYTLFVVSPMRDGQQTLLEVLRSSCNSGGSCSGVIDVLIRFSAMLAFCATQYWASKKMARFQSSTSELLDFTKNWKLKAGQSTADEVASTQKISDRIKALKDSKRKINLYKYSAKQIISAWEFAAMDAVNAHASDSITTSVLATRLQQIAEGIKSSSMLLNKDSMNNLDESAERLAEETRNYLAFTKVHSHTLSHKASQT